MTDHPVLVDGVDIRSLPKISLHDHLDGAVRPATIIELANEAGIRVPSQDADELAQWFQESCNGGSLVDYLTTFGVTCSVMQTRHGLTRVAREFVEDLAADGVIYGEVRWAPEQHLTGGLTLEEAVDAVQDGIDQAEAALGTIRMGQILSAMRQNDSAREIAELAVALRDRGVVGFDIAGPEDGFPPSDHREAFDHLANNFMPVTVHAGEDAGLDSIRSALLDGRALRLGHGIRIADDITLLGADEAGYQEVHLGELASWVRDRGIALEVSPSSNAQTSGFASMQEHPFDLLYQLGFNVTVNPDNRLQSQTSITHDLSLLADAFDYGLAELAEFQRNAAWAAFLPLEEREALVERIDSGWAKADR